MKKFVCSVCGYVHEGETAPEFCPICKAPKEKFVEQSAERTWAAEHVVGVAQGAPDVYKRQYLYIDGARCGYGLAAPENDVDLTDLARLTDVFYIGGTKVGALFGEAVVISSPALQRDFRYCIKRHGGMLAKGRLLGLQFEALFEDGLYLQLGRHGVEQALRIREACLRRGLPLHFDSRTNQQFPVLTRAQRERLEEKYALSLIHI